MIRFIFIFLVMNIGTVQAQVEPAPLASSIEILEMDRLGQLYLVNDKQEVLKYSRNGQLLARYSNFQLGAVGTLDASNPFAILVYYPNFQKAIILNRNLTEVSLFDLQEFGFWEVPTVALASDNNIWLVDPLDNILIKVDAQGNRIVQSANILQQTGLSPGILRIREAEQSVWLSTDQHFLWQYDVFGQWVQKLPFTCSSPAVQILRDRFFFLEEGEPYVFRSGALEANPLTGVQQEGVFSTFLVRETEAIILAEGEVWVYSFGKEKE
ncbi:MAG: hypothetical protein AAGH79_13245 [Bacteroidota bacterium]